jgi:hypothetical protein
MPDELRETTTTPTNPSAHVAGHRDVEGGDVARRYIGLKRRFWKSFFGGLSILLPLAFFSLFAEELHLAEELHPIVKGIIGVPLVVGFFSCWVTCVLTWSSLMRFRCPRCDKKFILTWYSSWPGITCKHCGLYLG